jgi:Tfp pilus assembly protein PilF
MPTSIAANLEKRLAAGKDNALLRFSLGNEYLKAGDAQQACAHLARALEHDALYSAAWKLYGKALEQCGRADDALAVYRRGIAAAEENGDKQAAKEMRIFAGRIERNRNA